MNTKPKSPDRHWLLTASALVATETLTVKLNTGELGFACSKEGTMRFAIEGWD